MKKDLSYYLKFNYVILLKQEEENGKTYYEAELPDLPGCGAYGKNKTEALKRLEEAKELWITSRLTRNLSIPEPSSEENFSGRILLRIPARLHMVISSKAKDEELSLNQYIRKNLEQGLIWEAIQKELKIMKQKIDELEKKPSFVAMDVPFTAKPQEGRIPETTDRSAFNLGQPGAANNAEIPIC